jgi:hypothetical protein
MSFVGSESKPATEGLSDGSTWAQITFTLDIEHYRMLWNLADEEHRPISSFVRESVIDFLKKREGM